MAFALFAGDECREPAAAHYMVEAYSEIVHGWTIIDYVCAMFGVVSTVSACRVKLSFILPDSLIISQVTRSCFEPNYRRNLFSPVTIEGQIVRSFMFPRASLALMFSVYHSVVCWQSLSNRCRCDERSSSCIKLLALFTGCQLLCSMVAMSLPRSLLAPFCVVDHCCLESPLF